MGNLTLKQKLNKLIKSGISFEAAQNKLLIKDDLASLTDSQKKFLKENKTAIITLIENQTTRPNSIQKSENGSPKLLSYSQQGLWLLDKINNGSHQYNIISIFSLKGNLNYEVLNKTFFTIIQRHESLRSNFFINKAGKPEQKLKHLDSFEADYEVLDKDLDDVEAYIKLTYKTEANRVFDLTEDLLINVKLLKETEELHYLIINMHHIASDGWSVGLLVNEFNILYNSFLKKESNPLPDLYIQYTDYANWQRQWLKGKVLDAHLDYWKNQLSNIPLLHNLPLDKPRPKVQRFKGSTYTSFVNSEDFTALQKNCKKEKASLFAGIYAVFSALLARYSNEKDIVVGSPVANREQSETANLVGFFMNLVVLRNDLSKNPCFLDLLRQSKKNIHDAHEYQQMPFDKVVEELKVNRSLSHSPLFQILLTMHNEMDLQLSLEDLTIEPYRAIEEENAKYDLSLDAYESKDGLRLVWEYDTDLFEETTIINLALHFDNLLASMMANPKENVFKLDIIGGQRDEELYKFLKGEELPIDVNDHVINEFNRQLEKNSKKIAVICNDQTYTYEDLGKRVAIILQTLVDRGVKKNDKVGLCLLRDFDLVAAIFACFKLGAAYIPLDPAYSSDRLFHIIEGAEPKCILSLKPIRQIILNKEIDIPFICLDDISEPLISKGYISNPNLEDTAYIIFTSGTTGKPKGIELTHLNLANLLKGFDRSFGQKKQQTWLAQTSINFDISVLELIWTVSRGHKIVLQPSNPLKLLAPENLESKPGLMDFSVMFFGADKSKDNKYDLLLDTVKFADKNDFKAIWTPERHFGEFGGAFPSPSVLSSALAMLTDKLQIRSGSIVLPLHDPIRVAEEWSIIDNLSNGRIGLSIASGWHPNDFVFYQADYQNRHQIMRDKIADLKKLWKGESIVRKNGVDKDFEIKIRPKPKQEDLPIWITAAGNPKTFTYAGEIGANILTHMLGQSIEQLAENLEIYYNSLENNGYQKEDTKVTLMLHTYIDATEEAAFNNSEQAFKDYLESSIKLMEPMAKAQGLDINTQRKEIIEIAYQKFSKENTLIGSPKSCQKMLQKIQSIGVNEVACLVDFGVKHEKVIAGLQKISDTKTLFEANRELYDYLEVDKQQTLLDLIESHKIDHIQMTPSQSRMLLNMAQQKKGVDLSSIKQWFIGGEAISKDLIKDLSKITNAKLYNMYGPTETTVWSAWREITPEDIKIGLPTLNTQLLLLNEFQQEVPLGVVGELYIGGFGLAKGYYNNIELTADRFKIIEDASFGKNRFYKTGDLLRLTQNGTFEFMGRADNQVKINGYRIELEDIESQVTNFPSVKNAAVIVRSSASETKKIVGYLETNQNFDVQSLKQFLNKKLPNYMIPDIFIEIESLPLTPNEKIDRKALLEVKLNGTPTTKSLVLPQTNSEKKLTEIWEETLELAKGTMSTKDNFFDLGGNSFLAINTINQIQQSLNIEISVIDFYKMPNVEDLASYIDSNTEQSFTENDYEIEKLADTMQDAFNKFIVNENR